MFNIISSMRVIVIGGFLKSSVKLNIYSGRERAYVTCILTVLFYKIDTLGGIFSVLV